MPFIPCTTIEGLSIFFYLIVVTSKVHITKEVLRLNSALLVRIVLGEKLIAIYLLQG